LTRGQDSLAIELDRPRQAAETPEARGDRPQLIVILPSAQELDEHVRLLADMEAENHRVPCVWRRFEAPWNCADGLCENEPRNILGRSAMSGAGKAILTRSISARTRRTTRP